VGEFDVCDRPGPATRYDPTAGHRIHTVTGLPECVHPYRVQMPVGRYASNGEPAPAAPAQIPPPHETPDPQAWLAARLRVAPVESTATAQADTEVITNLRDTTDDVLAAMRRVSSFKRPASLPSSSDEGSEARRS
jgi:hypothetical protein